MTDNGQMGQILLLFGTTSARTVLFISHLGIDIIINLLEQMQVAQGLCLI